MEELDQIVLQKKALHFNIRATLFDKRALDNPEGQVEVEFPNWSYLL